MSLETLRSPTEAEREYFAQLCRDYPDFRGRVLLAVQDVDTPHGIRYWVAPTEDEPKAARPIEEPI